MNMKLKTHEEKLKYAREALLCITVATVVGLVVYQIFLYLKLAIFGWNLGLAVAPLVAGYVETILAKRLIGEDIGAISAFILFAYTTFYSFILKNPTLGLNIITVGSVAVILQAAFPTVVNYLLFTVGLGTILYVVGFFKKITGFVYSKLKGFVYKHILKKTMVVKEEEPKHKFDEARSNEMLNNLDFIFVTSTDVTDRKIINLGQFHSTVIIEKVKLKSPRYQKEFETETLYNLKKGKDDCLIKLVENIKAAGGNGVIDLDIQYSLIGLGGDSYQVTAFGMGVHLT